ncbi:MULTISPECIES: hypothetical protein [Paenibacillus]
MSSFLRTIRMTSFLIAFTLLAITLRRLLFIQLFCH